MNYKNKYIGNEDQLMTVFESVLCQGRQKGVKTIHVENGGNLSVTILPDRGMDIYQVRYKGKNLNYIAPSGVVAPEYYDPRGLEWLRNFYVGFMTTLGLQHFGGPRVVDGDERGLHGKASNAPAEDVRITRGIEKGVPTVTVEGTMREAKIFGENLRLHRSIKFFYEQDRMEITDTVENYGFVKQPYVLGYHINYGWPLLDENAKVEVKSSAMKPRDEYAASFPGSEKKVPKPENSWPERCYIYDMKGDKKGLTGYSIKNPKKKIGVNVSFNANVLPKFCQWQYFQSGQYVMGLEPLCCEMDGPLVGEKNSPCPVLSAGESREYKLCFDFTDK